MILLGIILLVIGFLAGISILWTLGIIAIVVGLILAIAGGTGHAGGGRRWYYGPWRVERAQVRTVPEWGRSAPAPDVTRPATECGAT